MQSTATQVMARTLQQRSRGDLSLNSAASFEVDYTPSGKSAEYNAWGGQHLVQMHCKKTEAKLSGKHFSAAAYPVRR